LLTSGRKSLDYLTVVVKSNPDFHMRDSLPGSPTDKLGSSLRR